jgi:hypothetical protein
MLEAPLYLNNLKIAGNKITIYSSSVEHIGRRVNNGENLKTDRKKAYQGEQSINSINRVKENLYTWCYSIAEGNRFNKSRGSKKKIQLVMATLTLSSKQVHSDKEIKSKILEPFLKKLKYEYGIVNYFWRAEPQENGNIHFHLVIDKFIDKIDLQDYWNNSQNKLGYIDRYFEQTGKVNPPSTQVQVFSGSAKSIEYLLKYLTKENNRRKIEGLQMRVSNKLSHLKLGVIELYNYEENDLADLLESKAVRKYVSEYATIYYFNFDAYFYFSSHFITQRTLLYYRKIFDALYFYDLSSFEVYVVSMFFRNRIKFSYLMKDLERQGFDLVRVKNLLEIVE